MRIFAALTPIAASLTKARHTNVLQIRFSQMKRASSGPAIFLDRDGVINRRRPDDYVLNWSQFEYLPGIREALKELASLGLPMILISNQAAVGKGLLDVEGLKEITDLMYEDLAADGTVLTAAYYCTHRPDENCICRKPKPGLLFKAAEDFNVDLRRSIFVGDSVTDLQAARSAGCVPVLFGSDIRPEPKSAADSLCAGSPAELYVLVERHLHV